jgi:EpsI family protein
LNKKAANIKFTVVMGLLCSIFALANIKSEKKISVGKKIGLENVPSQIGDWKMINAEANSKLISKWEFLNEVITRTYSRTDGKVVWLAVTYGSDQRQVFAIHLPEGCYRAAGFDVESVGKVSIWRNGVKLKRLVGRGEGRTEAISYWVVLDGEVITNHLRRKYKQLYNTILKKPAYGALIRVSSFASEGDIEKEYGVQADFIKQLAQSLPERLRVILFGNMLNGHEL